VGKAAERGVKNSKSRCDSRCLVAGFNDVKTVVIEE
jgi:hypothetical protein